ncbi:c-type cytochrome [Nitrosomonas sp.]|uniref:c-type cytochrome n=1 Tax=Nitrosomonas sp. TaxID=42353 RepID=UPI0025E3AA09|nr:c-type cytochrome [Nitrosomonas sp.]MCC6915975.1 cytochrome c4 [Nitrosomonas sp.]
MKFIGTTVAAIAFTFSGFVSAETPAAGDVEKGKEIAAGICAGCHNVDGNSTIPLYPILAGQYPGYIAKQLHDFKAAEGEAAKRDNQIMAPMAANLSEEDITNVAAFYSQQKPQSGTVSDESLVEAGKKLYQGGNLENSIPACSSCHSPNGQGIPPHYPRIDGQYPAYTLSQLQAFRQGVRKNDTNSTMQTVVSRMSEQEMKAVSEYIATLR